MTTDATTLLIQRILSQEGSPAQGPNANLLGQADSIISTAADYAQILGTSLGPLAQAAGIAAAGGATAAVADAAGQAAALTSSAATAGIGAAVVLIFSFLLAALGDDSGSSETEALNQLNSEVMDVEDVVLADYWQNHLTGIISSWNSPTGGLGTDLDNLANEGIRGTDVKNDVAQFHDNALAFVNNFIPSKTPGAEVYWERPFVQSQAFAVKWVPYVWGSVEKALIYPVIGWYGKLPAPQAGPPLGGSAQQMASDPFSSLPFLLLGIQSYLAIEALVHLIDARQPTFSDFLTEFKGDLQGYASFIYAQHQLAVNGIVKTDLPSNADVLTFLYYVTARVSFPDDTPLWGGSPANQYTDGSPPPSAGYAWNGVYGAASAYPQYGVYEPSPPVPVPCSSPSSLIDIINAYNMAPQFQQAFGYAFNQKAVLANWTLPWVKARLILGRMARWKAIYLINGYDKVWSIIQNLRALSNQSPLPALTLTQDGTIASGNWSMRELCTVLGNLGGDLASPTAGEGLGPLGDSLLTLVQLLDSIVNGNWGGPPSTLPSGPPRPLGFRDRLAVAAVAGTGAVDPANYSFPINYQSPFFP